MFGRVTNSKKLNKIFMNASPGSLKEFSENFDGPSDFIQYFKEEIFDDLPGQLRALWESVEYIFQFKTDLPISDLLDFHLLNFVYHSLMEDTIYFYDEESEDIFIADIERVKLSKDVNEVKDFLKKNKERIEYLFRQDDETGIYAIIEEISPELDLRMDLLDEKIKKGIYGFIDEVHYLKLKNIMILHLILRSLMKKFRSEIESLIENEKRKFDKITDKKLFRMIEESNFPVLKSAFVTEKNYLVPQRFTQVFKSNQDDILEYTLSTWDFYKNMSTDIVLIYLKRSFHLNRMNKEKLAEILYSFLDILLMYDDVKIFTKEEWREHQEDRGFTPGEDNRRWRTYMIRQVEKYIPFFDEWVKGSLYKN